MTPVSIRHIKALDGLRGVAVIMVMLFHGELLRGGFLGVDLFFVLSGFLITSLLLVERETTRTIALGSFWARRARRLLPALALMLAAVLVYSVVAADGPAQYRIRADALATIGYVANWRLVFAHQSYFDLFATPTPLEHTWSLAIEEQFYLLWPLVLLGLSAVARRRRLAGYVLPIALFGLVSSTVLMFAVYNPDNTARAYFGTDTRAAALFAGIALAAGVALWGPVRGRTARVALEVAGFASIVGLAFMASRVSGESTRLYRGGFLMVAVAGAVVLAAAAHPRRGPIAWFLGFRPLCWLGLVSYGLYLWHWPVDVVLNADRVGLTGWPLFAVRTAVAVTIAACSYYWLEMPIRRGLWHRRTWTVAIPTVALTLLVGTYAATAGALDPNRDNPYPPRAGDRLIVVGDSVARSLAPGIARAGVNVGLEWSGGCRLVHGTITARLNGIPTPDCDWEARWSRAIKKSGARDVVMLIGIWDLLQIRPDGATRSVAPGSSVWDDHFRRQVNRAVSILSRYGAHVWMLGIPCAVSLDPSFHAGPYDIDNVVIGNLIIRDVAARRPDRATYLSLFSELCAGKRFNPVVDGVTTRSDGTHLSEGGADLVARWLLPQMGISVGDRPHPGGHAGARQPPRGGHVPARDVVTPPGRDRRGSR